MVEEQVIWLQGGQDGKGVVPIKVADIQALSRMVDRAIEAIPKITPYIAAGALGGVIGYYAHGGVSMEDTAFGVARLGLEAVLFTHLCTIENAPASNVFGVAGLTSILALVPIASVARWLRANPGASDQQLKQNNPELYKVLEELRQKNVPIWEVVAEHWQNLLNWLGSLVSPK